MVKHVINQCCQYLHTGIKARPEGYRTRHILSRSLMQEDYNSQILLNLDYHTDLTG